MAEWLVGVPIWEGAEWGLDLLSRPGLWMPLFPALTTVGQRQHMGGSKGKVCVTYCPSPYLLWSCLYLAASLN